MLHVHSVGRWIVLLLLLFAIFNSLIAGRRPFIKSDNRLGLLLTIFSDIMLLVGIYLYVVGERGYKMIANNTGGMGAVMKDPTSRFYAVEHIAGMVIAIVLIHIGKAQARKPTARGTQDLGKPVAGEQRGRDQMLQKVGPRHFLGHA